MKFLLNILILFFTCLLQASPSVAFNNLLIPTHTPTFSNQSTQKVESKQTKEFFHFARSCIDENIAKQTTTHFTTTKQIPSILKDAFQNFGVLQLDKSLSKSWVASQHFSTKEELSLGENRACERSDKFVSGAGNALRRIDDFIPSSGTQLIGSTNKTTTLLGRWIPDMQVVKGKMLPNEFNVGTEFGTEASNIGGFNFLNIPQIPLFFPSNISVRSTNLPAKPLYSQKQIQLL